VLPDEPRHLGLVLSPQGVRLSETRGDRKHRFDLLCGAILQCLHRAVARNGEYRKVHLPWNLRHCRKAGKLEHGFIAWIDGVDGLFGKTEMKEIPHQGHGMGSPLGSPN